MDFDTLLRLLNTIANYTTAAGILGLLYFLRKNRNHRGE